MPGDDDDGSRSFQRFRFDKLLSLMAEADRQGLHTNRIYDAFLKFINKI